MIRHTDAALLAAIAEATAAYQAAPSTRYLAAKLGYARPVMLRRLQRLARAGIVQPVANTGDGHTWRVTP